MRFLHIRSSEAGLLDNLQKIDINQDGGHAFLSGVVQLEECIDKIKRI